MPRMRIIALLLLAACLGCRHRTPHVPYVPSAQAPTRAPVDLTRTFYLTIHSFQKLASTNPTTFYLTGGTNMQGTVENDLYLGQVRTILGGLGHTETSQQDAKWLIGLTFENLPDKERTEQVPIYEEKKERTRGVINTPAGPRFYNSTTARDEVVGYTTKTQRIIGWFVRLEIYDGEAMKAEKIQQIYDARCTIVGTKGTLPDGMPLLLKEIFKQFPGEPAGTRKNQVFY